jgi:hypothetical protein
MIPSFKPGIMSSNQIRAAGGGVDVTPNAVDWNDVVSSVSATTNTVTITGINTAINLSVIQDLMVLEHLVSTKTVLSLVSMMTTLYLFRCQTMTKCIFPTVQPKKQRYL